MRRVFASALAGVALIALPVGRESASASTKRAFTGYSEAKVVSIEYGVPDWIVHRDRFVEHGGPTSAAFLESGGRSGSSASFPDIGYQADYPGIIDTVMTGSGISEPPVFPPYPLKASANTPGTPSQVVGDPNGPYFLTASATLDAVEGQARLGSADKESEASKVTSDVTQQGDQVSAVAYSVARGFVLGPLTVQSVRSRSTATYKQGDDQPVTTSELLVEGGKVGDLAFSFGPAGLQVAQSGVPVKAGEGLGKLNEALSPAGLQMHFTEPITTKDGISGAAFEVDGKHPVPIVAGSGREGFFRVRLGGVTSGISLGQELSAVDSTPEPPSSDSAPAGPARMPGELPSPASPSAETTASTPSTPPQGPAVSSPEEVVASFGSLEPARPATTVGEETAAGPAAPGIGPEGTTRNVAVLPAAAAASAIRGAASGVGGLSAAAGICMALGLLGIGGVITATVKKGHTS